MGTKEVSVVIKAIDATVSGLKSAKDRVASWASSIGGLVAGALAGLSFGAFASRAIDELTGAERAVSQLGNSLANVGIDFRKVKPDIDAAIASLQQVAAVDDDDALLALNRLVQLSGNYAGSVKNLTLVADVAAAKQIELSEAATLVGKVMAGTGAKGLKDFGIATKDPIEGIEQLRAKLKGAAEVELETLGGALKGANIAFGDVAQATADVVASTPAFRQFAGMVVDGLRAIAGWLIDNKAVIGVWVSFTLDAVGFIGRAFLGLGKVIWDWQKAQAYGFQVFGWTVVRAILTPINAVPVAINRMIELANRLPGVDIKVRMPELTGILDEAKEKAADARALMVDSGHDVWSNLKGIRDAWEKVGSDAETAGDRQVGVLKRTREELAKNKAAHDALRAAEAAAEAAAAAKKDDAARAKAESQKDASIGLWEKAGSMPQYRGQAVAALEALKAETEFLLKGNVPLARKLELMERLAKVQGALTGLGAGYQGPSGEQLLDSRFTPISGKAGDRAREGALETGIDASAARAAADAKNMTVADVKSPDLGFMSGLGASIQEQVGPATGAIESLGEAFTDITAGPLLNFGDAITVSMEALVSGSGGAGKAFLSSMTNAIKGVASQKGKLFAGEALGALGAGFMGHPGAFASAAKYGAAAALMFTIAGAAGGVGGSGGGGGGGSSPQDARARTQDSLAAVNRGTVTLVLKGRKFLLDGDDPDDRDGLRSMIEKLTGDRELNIVYDREG